MVQISWRKRPINCPIDAALLNSSGDAIESGSGQQHACRSTGCRGSYTPKSCRLVATQQPADVTTVYEFTTLARGPFHVQDRHRSVAPWPARRREKIAHARLELAKGIGIGKVARATGLGTGTVHKLKREMAATA
jgi:hypothetical protein